MCVVLKTTAHFDLSMRCLYSLVDINLRYEEIAIHTANKRMPTTPSICAENITNAPSKPGPCVSKLDAGVVIKNQANHKKHAKENPNKRNAEYLSIFIFIMHCK
jgi:hypothetical protein